MVNAPEGLNQVILRKVRRFRSFVCQKTIKFWKQGRFILVLPVKVSFCLVHELVQEGSVQLHEVCGRPRLILWPVLLDGPSLARCH